MYCCVCMPAHVHKCKNEYTAFIMCVEAEDKTTLRNLLLLSTFFLVPATLYTSQQLPGSFRAILSPPLVLMLE